MGHDSDYLKTVIGDVLNQGLAATLVESPDDPVDYLGHWLLDFVSIQARKEQVSEQYRQDVEKRRADEERGKNEARLREVEDEKREQCLNELIQNVESGTITDVYNLWNFVVDAATQWTEIRSAYVGLGLPPPPVSDEDSLDVEDTEDDDEPLISLEASEEQGEETVEDGDAEPVAEKIALIEVVAAANESQRFMLHKTIARLVSEEAEENEVSLSRQPVFKLIEEELEELYVRHCVDAEGIEFLSGTPKIGSCLMCPLTPPSSTSTSLTAVLVCDTLSPPGSGSPISQSDQKFLSKLAETARVLTTQLLPQPLPAKTERATWLRTLQERIQTTLTEQPENTEVSESQKETAERTEEETEQTTAAASEEVQSLFDDIKEIEDTLKRDDAFLTKQQDIFTAVKESIGAEVERLLRHLRCQTRPPVQTHRLLQLASALLGKPVIANVLASEMAPGE